MPATGLIFESFHFKDVSHERIFGSAPSDIQIVPFNHDISGLPVVYQGNQNTCVACSITWIRQWMEKNDAQPVNRLSWPFLAKIANIGPNGAAPSAVLEPARKTGICRWDSFDPAHIETAMADAFGNRVPSYSFLTDYSKAGIYTALQRGPLAVGVLNWKGIGDHMMAAYGATDGGLNAVSWWDEDHQTLEVIPWEQVEVAISFAPFINTPTSSICWLEVLQDQFVSLFKYVK